MRRRVVFSRSVLLAGSHHADVLRFGLPSSLREGIFQSNETHRLLDDLTSRSVDPMFYDARLVPEYRTTHEAWITRIIVFILCIAVGFSTALFVQQLQEDPRKEVRKSLAAELRQQDDAAATLGSDVASLQTQVDAQVKAAGTQSKNTAYLNEQITNALSKVRGPGVTVTLTNPGTSAKGTDAGRVSENALMQRAGLVTDSDMQQFVLLLWQAGAEAVSVNGYRIGTQTSVRAAGSTILVGTHQIESPYMIEAIGPQEELAQAVEQERQPAL